MMNMAGLWQLAGQHGKESLRAAVVKLGADGWHKLLLGLGVSQTRGRELWWSYQVFTSVSPACWSYQELVVQHRNTWLWAMGQF